MSWQHCCNDNCQFGKSGVRKRCRRRISKMPQGRRKTPFSGKAKKEQLKSKKQSKLIGAAHKKTLLVHKSDDEEVPDIQKLNIQPNKGRSANKYALQFFRESDAEISERKELARGSLHKVTEKELEIDGDDYFPKELDFPVRPPWSYSTSVEALEAKEQRYFSEYVADLEQKFGWKDMSFFELNLETWRQLWRVLEMSDIVLIIVDVRFPALMFPPSLYEYVNKTLKKDMIVIINKIDLAPAPLVAAWKNYFKDRYPDLHVLMFTTVPGYNLMGKQSDKAGLIVRRRKGRLRMAAEGTQLLFDACKAIAGADVDLSSWQHKIKEEISQDYDADDDIEIGETIDLNKVDVGYFEHEKYKSGILTIGCIGQPNVGKSSVMNAIKGKKVVSVSKTPGHTKHFQTIFLTPTVRLCDCPGLVFPSKVPKVLQILMGSFPIAQLREPFTTIKYLAERLDLPKLLRIDHPDGDEEWSAMDICDGWAKKRGYITAKAARLDTYRAANGLLRMALDGKLCLCLRPPNFLEKKEYWHKHPDVEVVRWIQARTSEDSRAAGDDLSDSDVSEDEVVEPPRASGSTGLTRSESEESSDGEESEGDVQVSANRFAALHADS